MSKSAADWCLANNRHDIYLRGAFFTEEDVRAIQADARAGMVAEVDMATLRTHLSDEIHRLEAELARAWCAGRDAAADWHDAHGSWDCPTHYLAGEPAGPKGSAAIRALQPPGGKAK